MRACLLIGLEAELVARLSSDWFRGRASSAPVFRLVVGAYLVACLSSDWFRESASILACYLISGFRVARF